MGYRPVMRAALEGPQTLAPTRQSVERKPVAARASMAEVLAVFEP